MEGIYSRMNKDWETYCLMSSIALIEEMSKPKLHKQLKSYKGETANYDTFRTLRLKVKEFSIIDMFWRITRNWEDKLKVNFIGSTFKDGPKIEQVSGQYYFYFTPNWLYHILKSTGKLPSKFTFDTCFARLHSMTIKRSGTRYFIPKEEVNQIQRNSVFNKLFSDKFLAAGAFIVSFDLEFRGLTTGQPSLCMTTKFEDFLSFLLSVANHWSWATANHLSNVNIEHPLSRGIKATPKKEFRLKLSSLKEIYDVAGPLSNEDKDGLIKFHIARSLKPQVKRRGRARKIILELLKDGPNKSTEIQKYAKIRVDVVLDHLKKLEKENLVKKVRMGKYYLWSLV